MRLFIYYCVLIILPQAFLLYSAINLFGCFNILSRIAKKRLYITKILVPHLTVEWRSALKSIKPLMADIGNKVLSSERQKKFFEQVITQISGMDTLFCKKFILDQEIESLSNNFYCSSLEDQMYDNNVYLAFSIGGQSFTFFVFAKVCLASFSSSSGELYQMMFLDGFQHRDSLLAVQYFSSSSLAMLDYDILSAAIADLDVGCKDQLRMIIKLHRYCLTAEPDVVRLHEFFIQLMRNRPAYQERTESLLEGVKLLEKINNLKL